MEAKRLHQTLNNKFTLFMHTIITQCCHWHISQMDGSAIRFMKAEPVTHFFCKAFVLILWSPTLSKGSSAELLQGQK